MTALLSCPFCGSKAVEIEEITDSDGRTETATVECTICMAGGPEETAVDRAAQAWNVRAASLGVAQQPMGLWCIPAGEGNECVICEGDDPNRPGKIVFVLRAPHGLNDRYRTSHEFLAEQAALVVRAVNECGAESNRHSGAVGAEKRAEQSNPGGEDVTHLPNSQNGSHLQKPLPDEPTPAAGGPSLSEGAYEKCPTCDGHGLALNMAGEPDTCPECKGNTVVSPLPEGNVAQGESQPVAWCGWHPKHGYALQTVGHDQQHCASLLMRTDIAGNHGWSCQPLYAGAMTEGMLASPKGKGRFCEDGYVLMPQSREEARAMLLLAENYLFPDGRPAADPSQLPSTTLCRPSSGDGGAQ